jgi:hypothetical protein
MLIETNEPQKLEEFLERSNINFIKLNEKCVAIDKSHKHDLQNIIEKSKIRTECDENIGVITIVGQNSDIQFPKNIHVKHQRVSDRSNSIVVPFQQTAQTIVLLHEMLFG